MLLVNLFVVAVVAFAQIQDHPGQYSAADIEAGSRVYAAQCSLCHGPNGDVVTTVDLRRGRFRRAASDDELARLITNGIPDAGMPGFKLQPEEINGLVAFIRAGFDLRGTAVKVGDAARGRDLFQGKGGCGACHRAGGAATTASRLAPDLSDIGAIRSPAGLQRSIVDPTSGMLPINRPVRAVTKDGRTIRGRRLNEDTYSVQLIDESEQVVSLLKADLREYEIATVSPMPAYASTFTGDELADLVAYLLSLTGSRVGVGAAGPVTPERLLRAGSEPRNWLTYSGAYESQRYSRLDQISPANVRNLEQQWVLQGQVMGAWQATPLVVDGIMYVTQRPNDLLALDAKTGRVFWLYRYAPSTDQRVCCGANNRGVAILGDTLFMGTLDAHLIAIDAKSGKQVWNVNVGDAKLGYSITLSPLVVKDKVIVGVGGGEFGIRGFIAAFDAKSGQEAWRFNTIPGPGEPGHDTWKGDAWKNGGGSVWVTGSYDPALNLTFWGVGNPGPDWNNEQRPGDNLYTDSVVALDADTGRLKWHFQFTPNDPYDYDSVQVPVLVDMNWRGPGSEIAKLILWANRNGYFYALDRATGRFLSGTPFVKVNWASALDERGRPIQTPQPAGSPTWPGNQGGTNWYSPSYSPRTQLFYVSAWEGYASIYRKETQVYEPGRNFTGGGFTVLAPVPGAPTVGIGRRSPLNNWTDAVGHGAVIAIDPRSGEQKWKFDQFDVSDSGILTTASDLLFTGGREGYFHALDARTGALLWKASLGGQIVNGPMTYEVDGRQYVAVISGMSLVAFALRN